MKIKKLIILKIHIIIFHVYFSSYPQPKKKLKEWLISDVEQRGQFLFPTIQLKLKSTIVPSK